MRLGQQRGTLSTWKDKRGYGFITPNDAKADIFIHISAFKDLHRRPRAGDRVGYDILTEDGKQRACHAFIVTPRAPKKYFRFKSSKHLVWKVLPWCVLPLACSIYLAIRENNFTAILFYGVISLLTYYTYADDKKRAQFNHWRVSESTLHLLEFVGGWPGGLVAQQVFRHKTKKRAYQVTFWSIVGVHYGGWLIWLGASL
jgi:uncharacterized membrane protein YsdA (DUF1294 family)/cold shock CspA family protein